MAEKIASLFAEIGADTSKLKDGLGQTKDGLEKTGGVMSKLKSSFLSSWTEMSSAIDVTKQAIGMAQGAIDKTVGATAEYAAQVRDLSRASGMGAEETSRLIQVADDLTVSYDTLRLSLRTATQQGITLSTDALAKLSDEYVKLAPGVERNEFLIKNFGRAGLEMAKVLEVGGDNLRKMSDGMSSNMVLTEANVAAARQYEIALDDMGDAALGLQYSIGTKLIPVLVEAEHTLMRLINWDQDIKNTLREHSTEVLKTSTSYAEYNAEMKRATDASGQSIKTSRATTEQVNAQREAVGWLSEAEYNAVKATEAASDAYSDAGAKAAGMTKAVGNTTIAVVGAKEAYWQYADAMQGAGNATNTLALAQEKLNEEMSILELALGDQVGKELERFQEQTRDLGKEGDALKDKIAGLEQLKYRTPEQEAALAGLREDLAKTEEAVQELAKEHDKATKQIIFNMVEQQLVADGLSSKEGDLLMKMALKWGLIDQATYDSYGSFLTLASGVDATSDSVDTLIGKFENWAAWNGRNISLDTFMHVYTQSWGPNNNSTSSGGPGGGPGGVSSQYVPPPSGGSFDPGASWYPHAAGGSFVIPPGYAESWRLGGGHTASSGEVVTVTPKGKAAGNVTINVIGANKSPEQIAHEVARVIQRGR